MNQKTETPQKKKIIMSATFMLKMENGISMEDWVESGKGYVDIGGFEVIVNGKPITFDFESNSWWKNTETNHTYTYSNYNGFAEKIHDVDPCHEEYWAEVGLKPEDITAELLGSAEELSDFYIAVYDINDDPIAFSLSVLSMDFENENGDVFSINTSVLQNYNKKLREKQKK